MGSWQAFAVTRVTGQWKPSALILATIALVVAHLKLQHASAWPTLREHHDAIAIDGRATNVWRAILGTVASKLDVHRVTGPW